MGPLRFLQGNLNHSARAQDLFLQSLAEGSVHIGVAAEPYRVPSRRDWIGDLDGVVAITTQSPVPSPALESAVRGHGFVAAQIGGT